ncbi:MAG: TonB-dependent receptor [Lysobacteraceae bacterium]|nr:MAG: TonB-dependent receptor [Xanthomonadaceae bacterium]
MRRLPLAAAVALAFSPSLAWAQSATTQVDKDREARTLDTITVTAQKRVENLQEVPISLQVLGNQQLEQQNVAGFGDYAKLIPSLSFGTSGGGVFSGPGFVQLYMRGVASGNDANHSSSQPSAAMYLDEQPITTITGALDIHMYDIERVEALAGPQGTLYGANSQSGTVRIITRKPDPSGYSAGFSVEGSKIEDGGIGHVLEGFVNLPINDRAAVRLVGWQKHDAGYVDNIRGTRTFPNSGITIDNADRVEKDFNDADTVGVRGALRFDINDEWTITPALVAQKMKAHGSTGVDPNVGNPDFGYDASSAELAVKHFYPESSDDRWHQAALTVEGKIGNFDLTYVFSDLKRDVDSEADYADYGFWYDALSGYVNYDDNGDLINPSQYIQASDGYKRTSHELRISTPQEHRLRMVAGLFWQRQSHDIFQRYRVDDLATDSEVNGWADTIWLTAQQRKDRDKAVFGELAFDLSDRLTLTGGMRFFRNDNSLKGFFGYGDGFSGSTGVSQCFSDEQFHGAPCVNLDKGTDESDHIGRVNLTWQARDSKMVYATWSQGYRPGGINRRGTLPPYQSDFLTNYELGWKTSWGKTLVFNGALFREEWDDFQFSYLGANGLTEIRNANAARIDGLELDLAWAATYNLQINGGFAWYDAKLTQDYCAATDAQGGLDPSCFGPLTDDTPDRAFSGTRLPVTAKFKGNLNARYTFDWRGGEAYWQASVAHQGDRTNDLREKQGAVFGKLGAYTLTDLSAGWKRDSWAIDIFLKNAFNTRAQLARFSECAALTCGTESYTVFAQPRTLGVRFSKEF